MFQYTLIGKICALLERFGYTHVTAHDCLNWHERKIHLLQNLETKRVEVWVGVYHKDEAIIPHSSEFGVMLTEVIKSHEDHRRRTGDRQVHPEGRDVSRPPQRTGSGQGDGGSGLAASLQRMRQADQRKA